MEVTTKTQNDLMEILDPVRIKQEMALSDPKAVGATDTAQEDDAAGVIVDKLLQYAAEGPESRDKTKAVIESFGEVAQTEAAHKSRMLERPIKDLSKRGDDGGQVANALIELKMKVEELDPSGVDFSKPGWFSRALGILPFVGTPLKKYFSRYEAAQTVIGAILASLDQGQKQLQRDNGILMEDQKALREATLRLEKAIKTGTAIDRKLEYKLERDLLNDADQQNFVREELLFPLRQRIMDLQQQLVVSQQGVLAIEVIVRNNKELIRGVDRSKRVTVNALQVAVTVALALAQQKIVLDKISEINQTTNQLIADTAARLKQQGVEIHKQASTNMLDMETLKGAFRDINAAMDDIATFRRQALPQMAKTIVEFVELTEKGEAAIAKFERGNRVEPAFVLDIE